jgi:hypothetical protein
MVVAVILERGTPLHLVSGPINCEVITEVCNGVNAPIVTLKNGGCPHIRRGLGYLHPQRALKKGGLSGRERYPLTEPIPSMSKYDDARAEERSESLCQGWYPRHYPHPAFACRTQRHIYPDVPQTFPIQVGLRNGIVELT